MIGYAGSAMTSAPATRGITPADTDVRLDEQLFVNAVLNLQPTQLKTSDAETAWRRLLTTSYDLCFAHMHDLRTGRTQNRIPAAQQFIDDVIESEHGETMDECQLATMHELLLERTPRWDAAGTLHADAGARHRREHAGAFYTPTAVVEALLDRALDPILDKAECSPDPLHALLALRVCDPACGVGHFLVHAGHRIVARAAQHADPRDHHRIHVQVFRSCLHGAELDPITAHVCRRRLWSLAGDTEVPPSIFNRRIHIGHGLVGAPPGTGTHAECDAWCAEHLGSSGLDTAPPVHWHLLAEQGFDLVIGNPPFLNQLATDTAIDRAIAGLLRERFGDDAKGYADAAALFLRMAVDLVGPGGRVALLQPWSMLAARDTGGIRRALAHRTRLTDLWVALEHVFDAGVHVCAPVLERTTERTGLLHRASGADFTPADPIELDMARLADEETWSPLVSDLMGIPRISVTSSRLVGELADATADFRDQYYGLRDCVVEPIASRIGPHQVPLITTGLVDPGVCRWGMKPTRYDGRRWSQPVVDLQRVRTTTDLGPWTEQRLVPKLLLATQTKVLEVCVDREGNWLPLTPLITIRPHDLDHLWHLAAALASPVATAIAAARYLGTARSTDAIKLSARQVQALPLPDAGAHWDAAATAFQAASDATDDLYRRERLIESGLAACMAYGCSTDERDRLMHWWSQRLPG